VLAAMATGLLRPGTAVRSDAAFCDTGLAEFLESLSPFLPVRMSLIHYRPRGR